jgi:ketosteroid isomerase-like protein
MEMAERTREERILGLPDPVRHERIQLIQKYWTALNTGDLETFETLLAPDAVIHYPGNHSLSGDYRTTADIVDLYRHLTQFIAEGVFHGEVLDIMVGEVYTAVVLRYDIKLPIKTLAGRAIGLFVIEQGKIKEYWLHEWDQVLINTIFRLDRLARPLKNLVAGGSVVPRPRPVESTATTPTHTK